MEKLDSLKNFDEKKLAKLGKERKEWLSSGEDKVIKGTTEINKLADSMFQEKIIVKVKAILKENENFKTIVLSSLEGQELPTFKAGQRIAVTITKNDKEYTSSFSLSSNPVRATNGEYQITFKYDENEAVSEYLFNEVKKDDIVVISGPFGDFYYSSLIDEENVIAIISDNGIAPIMAMAQSIISGIEDFNLTIFYSEKYESDLIFKEELLEYAESSNKIKVNFVLSSDVKEDMMNGFVSLDKIRKEYVEGKTSFFVAGSEGLLKYLDNELKSLKLPKKFIKYDSFLPRCNIKKTRKYNLTIYINDLKYEVPCYNNKTIINAIYEAGISIRSRCHNGTCGLCRSELVKGEVKIVNDKRIKADKTYNYIHPCSTYPLSDIEIVVR